MTAISIQTWQPRRISTYFNVKISPFISPDFISTPLDELLLKIQAFSKRCGYIFRGDNSTNFKEVVSWQTVSKESQ
jgi:hypothetical protein